MLFRATFKRAALSSIVLFCLRLPGQSPVALTPFSVVKDVTYLEPGRAEKLDIYLPNRAPHAPPSPAVIWIHGHDGDKEDGRERNVCSTLAGAGYVCASINWGPDSPFWVLPVLDCKNAVRFLRVHAEDFHINPEQIAIGGGSGGGYLAMMAGFTVGEKDFEPPKPYPGVSNAVSAILDFYGVYDKLTLPGFKKQAATVTTSLAGVRQTADEIRLFSPASHLTSSAPPVLIAQGRDDPLCDFHQSIELDQDLTSKGVPHELILLDCVGHSFDLTTWNKKPLPRDLRPVVLSFLKKHLIPAPGKE